MKNYTVLKDFTDKHTSEVYLTDSVYKANAQRANELQELGYLGDEATAAEATKPDADAAETQIEHTGGGWFQLSNGEKVKGKDEAIEAQKKLNEGGADAENRGSAAPDNTPE